MGGESRFRSLQVGVCQESHGENIHRNMSWAGYDRALPPEMIPQNLFDRLFGVRDQSWVEPQEERPRRGARGPGDLQPSLGQAIAHRLDEHLTSVRELERAIASLPSDYGKNVKEPEDVADLTDYPRIAKIQSRPRGARAGVGPDARRVVHADEVPEPRRGSRGSATRACAITTTRTPTPSRPKGSASCATSAAGTSRSSPTCWPS